MILHIQPPHGVAGEEANSLLDEVLKAAPILSDSLTDDWRAVPESAAHGEESKRRGGGSWEKHA